MERDDEEGRDIDDERLPGVGTRMGARLDSATLLPPEPAAAASARRFLRHVEIEVSDDVLDVLLLLTSELVSNAVRHGRGEVRLTIETDDAEQPRRIRVGVADDNPTPPTMHVEAVEEYGTPAESGRGVLLLERLAHRWGVVPEPPGKQVWFEVDVAA